MRGIIRRWGAHSHSHSGAGAAEPSRVVTSRLVTWIALGLLATVAAFTVLGLFLLKPDYAKVAGLAERADYMAPGATFERGEILGISEECGGAAAGLGASGPTDPGRAGADATGTGQAGSGSTDPEQSGPVQAGPPQAACLELSVGLRTGPDAGRLVSVEVRGSYVEAGLREGDEVELMAYPKVDPGVGPSTSAGGDAVGGAAGAAGGAADSAAASASERAAERESGVSARYEFERGYEVSGVLRGLPLLLLTLVFAAVVIWVGRLRGLLALVALVISAGVLLAFVLPALVSGGPGLPIALVGSSAIMFVILYLVHGPNLRTTAALVGTLFGILIMALVSLISVKATRLSGIGDESSSLLSAMTSEIDFRGLLSCAIIIAGLGVLNDVTITQASAVWELRAAAPAMSRHEIYSRAMRIGRDHIASTVYTVFFAYVGAALSVLIVLYLYDRPVLSLLTREDIAIEIVRTLCGSIGLILAVPVTTWAAALFVPPAEASLPGGSPPE
ncbi:YibE/F family protein [Leucobacter ruminantium]|uniref:YibE/F family protein n=1 Tax=Leucobacter ruminantium TaxID=1289170 RepID=A0A939RWV8_9MICO|nr:YibE/F family protein [Leucobacter ruminantium]MBO1804068.1 YibE/F family protein [Leucobacter ruminantium]